jgi:hypothetical protein
MADNDTDRGFNRGEGLDEETRKRMFEDEDADTEV